MRLEPVKTFRPYPRAEQERGAALQPIEALPIWSDSAPENLHVTLLFHNSHFTLLAASHNRKTESLYVLKNYEYRRSSRKRAQPGATTEQIPKWICKRGATTLAPSFCSNPV